MLLVPLVVSAAVACGGGGGGSDSGACGAGQVRCAADNYCCPASQPFFCGAPMNPGNLGCYATLDQARAVCSSYTFNGTTMNEAYSCE